jgi:type I restriction-modification system DNA methylase subunit
MIEIALPPTQDNHLKFKAAIVQTLQELNNLNIRSAMNSGTDVLGKFYEVFLKYGNGAKEIGIVLTPRHITKFAVDAVGVSDRDIVYDPTCGTGGFLVSAFDAVKRSHSTAQVNRFKQNGLFGVEQDPDVVALAIVNMIFRGDGKTHIVEGSCFQRRLIRAAPGTGVTAELTLKDQAGEGAATRVLMNPPFALPSAHEKEFHFVDRALAQMQDGGILFSVLPYPAMVKQSAYKEWRMALLRQHTLLAVMTFPDDLFYPIGVHTVGIFVKKGIPQPAGQNVLWLRALHDGMLKSKGKRLPSATEPNDFAALQDTLQAFLQNPGYPVANIEQLQKACPVDVSDPMLELVPENYLDQAAPTQEEIRRGGERIIRNSIAYLVQAGGEHA